MKYLVEYLGDEGNVSITHRLLGRVYFPANPYYGGRRIVEVETSQLRDELLEAGNPHGVKKRYDEPVDLLSRNEELLVAGVLAKFGLIDEKQIQEVYGSQPAEAPQPLPIDDPKGNVQISEAAMALAVEADLDPRSLQGTGKDGTVRKADVEAAIAARKED